MTAIIHRVAIKDLIGAGEAVLKTGPFGTQLKASDYTETGIPVINVRNIGMGNIRLEKLEYISSTTRDRLSSHILHESDIVFGRKGAVDRHVFIRREQEGWFQGSDCLRLRLSSNRIDSRFASYFFLTSEHQQWMINQCSHGATMASLNQDIIERIELPTPPISTQHKIVTILSAYDDLIENNLRRINILEEMAQNLYREWFVKFRFPDHDHILFVDSAMGNIPDTWRIEKLGSVCMLTMGQSPKSEFYNDSGNGYPFHQGVTNFGDRIPTDRLYCSADGRMAEAGDILFSVRAPVGRMNIADKKIILGRGLAAIRHRNGFQAFLWEQLRARFTEVDMIGNGAIFASVTKTDMENIPLICPPDNLIRQATDYLLPLHKKIEIVIKQVALLRQTRDLLLPKLISGRIDVADLDIAIREEIAA